MVFPEPKNVIFDEILLRPNFSPRNSGLPYFYRVKLDVIGFGQKAHFWNRETSYIKVLYMISHELDDVHLKFFKMTREGGHGVGLGTNLVANAKVKCSRGLAESIIPNLHQGMTVQESVTQVF